MATGGTDGRTDGRTEGRTSRNAPLCPTGHRPFGAAAQKGYIIDRSCPSDSNVSNKENEKITKYSGLRVELAKMWNSKCTVIPVVIGGGGAWGHIPQFFKLSWVDPH